MSGLVLSLFPGIGLLDMAFEEEGFCIVRGPDLLWGGDVRRFHPPAGKFDGVIGGPPCQLFSQMRHINPNVGVHGNQIPEFERVVKETRPVWFVMENVKDAPAPIVDGYVVDQEFLNNRWLGEEQNRLRRFSFGSRDGRRLRIETTALESPLYERAITSCAGKYWWQRQGKEIVDASDCYWRPRRGFFPRARRYVDCSDVRAPGPAC
jgi:DNA (cytosine-5)-methyltransferase 1